MQPEPAFRPALLAASAHDGASDPFVLAVCSGLVPRESLRPFAIALTQIASAFPSLLASIFARCDRPEARAYLLENILEETGVVSFLPTEGLTIDAGRGHGELARRFARSLGVQECDLRGQGDGSGRIDLELAQGNWIGPLAFVALGFERNFAVIAGALLTGFRECYGLTGDEVEFFSLHAEADERHGAEALEIIVGSAREADERRHAIEGARKGVAALNGLQRYWYRRALAGRSAVR